MKALTYAFIIAIVKVILYSQLCQGKVKSAIRKLIKKPLKIQSNLEAKPQNQESDSISITEGDDNEQRYVDCE